MGRAQQRKKKGKERLDRYYHLAKEQGFRARSAFKLIQLAQKYDLFTNCRVAVDLCAAPGGWMQVCARHMPLSSLIIGVDLAPIQPIKGCTAFQGDITTQECRSKLKKLLLGGEADLFLHDGSPNMGMDWSIDAFNQNVLVLHAAHLACEFLKKGGIFVSKVFRSSDYASLLYVLQQLFTKVEATKPQASRNVSAEIFVVCKGFRKPDKTDPRLFDPKFAFLAVDDEIEGADAAEKPAKDSESTEGPIVPQKTKVKLAEAFKNSQKRRRGGYGSDETGYKTLTLTEFFNASSPVEALLNASELKASSLTERTPSEFAQSVLAHRLTTPEIKSLWGDLKVLGKRELSQLLKWRFKIKRELALQQKLDRPAANEGQTEAPGQDEPEEEQDAEERIDEELAALHAEVSHQVLRQQRKAAKKQKLLQTKQQFSRNAFSASERDPDLFTCTKATLDALAGEDKMVDAELLLTGGEPEGGSPDSHLPFSESIVLPKGKSLEKQMRSAQADDDDSDLDAIDRMEVDLEVGLRLRALAQAEKGGSAKAQKQTRRARVLAERTEEMRVATDDLQARALEHLSKTREAEEYDSDGGDEDERLDGKAPDTPAVHEYLDDEPLAVARAPKATNHNSTSSTGASTDSKAASSAVTGREAQAAARWFSQPLFSSAAVDEVAETLLAEDFDPVVQRHQPQQQQIDDEDDAEIKELDDSELPQIPLSEKQKRQQRRKREELKKAAKEAKRGHKAIDDEIGADDKPQKIEEVPPATFAPPRDAEEAAEFQAMGAMLIRRSSRMDLIDGAYNRYAFNDDHLPEWFLQDEEKHNKPELPVTKELMKEYRQKIREINSRPIRKVQEAQARKKKRALRVLEKVKRQAQGIADSSELSEAGKAKAIARLSKKARQATARKEKTLVIARRVGGGKAAQKSQGKNRGSKSGGRAVKLVDRRLKKDKRAMQRLQGKSGKKGGKAGKKPAAKGRKSKKR